MADTPAPSAFEVLYGIDALERIQSATVLSFDTETTGLRPVAGGLRLLQLAPHDSSLVVVIDLWQLSSVEKGRIRTFMEAPFRQWYAHNAVFDLSWLQENDLYIEGDVMCTMLAARLLNNGRPNMRSGLAAVAKEFLDVEVDKEEQKSDWSQIILTEKQKAYAAKDVAILRDLVPVLLHRLKVVKLEPAWALECRAVPAIAHMQRTGLPFSRQKLQDLEQFYIKEIDRLGVAFVEQLDAALPEEHKLPRDLDGSFNLRAKASGSVRLGTKTAAGFNLNSPKQLVEKFSVLLGEIPVESKTNKPSASRNALRSYAADHEVIQTYLSWKRAEKRRQMVIALLEHQGEDGFIRANYMQLGADTGRMSCREPNLQQVPRDKGFRLAAEAPEGWCFVCADFGQMELRLAAAVSGDTLMTRAFQNNEDLHTLTAQAVYGVAAWEAADDARRKYMRQVAKACFSGDTEVLTPTGWVRLDAYTGGPVAQYCVPGGVQINPATKKPGPGYVAGRVAPWDGNNGVLEFVEPVDYRSFMSSDVWHCEDRNTAITATGNHDIFYVDAYGVARKRQLVDVASPRSFVAAGYLKRDAYSLDAVQTRVLAMIVADGSFKQSNGYVSLGFSKRRKIRRCVELLDAAGITYNRSVYKNGDNEPTTFFKFRESEAAWLRCYVDPDKVLSLSDCLRLDALVYLEEAQYWDGAVHVGESRDRVFVSTVVKESADVMQAMAVTSGIPCTITTEHSDRYSTGACYKVSYAFGTAPVWRPSWDPVKAPEQMVHCVQVPSGLLLVRKHNKVCVQGNCNFGLLYGSGAKGLRDYAGAMGITMTLEEAEAIRDTFHLTYTGISRWQQENAIVATKSAKDSWAEVRVPGNELRRFLPGDLNRLTTRCNTPIQGAGAAVLKLALSRLWPHLREAGEDQVRLAAVVHDEVLLLVRQGHEEEWKHRLSSVMEAAEAKWLGDIPPLAEAASGPTWQDAK